MIFYTSICSNYLPKAMALAESVKQHCPGATFVLCLVEREVPEVAANFKYFDKVVLAKDAGWENFDAFIFRHSIVEASTAVKPRFMQYLMERYQHESKFIYLDPDVLVYSEFVELEELLNEHSIVLCPHLLRPGNVDMEISSLAHGTYNLGFLAVSRSKNAIEFLDWWSERLFYFCYDDKVRGIFTDQKWIDLAPCFYEVKILKHHGYDFATWSLLGSDLREIDGNYVINGDRLRFIHFSGLDSGTIDKAIGWWLTEENKDVFVKLFGQYKQLLQANGQATLGGISWSYSTYTNHEPVSRSARVAYRDSAFWSRLPFPFESSDAEIHSYLGDAEVSLDANDDLGGRSQSSAGILSRLTRSVQKNGIGPTVIKAIGKVVGRH